MGKEELIKQTKYYISHLKDRIEDHETSISILKGWIEVEEKRLKRLET